ncbi:MAG: hypothetical protein ACK5CY_06755 [Bacteroidia bacterium]
MKGQINIGNIGWYLLQAQEGSLNAQEMDALCAFLERHPELIPDTEAIFIASDIAQTQPKFTHLKKEDFDLGAFDMLAVSVLEGERHENDIKEATAKNDNLSLQWRAFQHTKLMPESITFPEKNKLYRKRVQYLWIRYAAAACIAALFVGLGWFAFSDSGEKQQLVNNVSKSVNEQSPIVKADIVDSTSSEIQQKPAVASLSAGKNIQTDSLLAFPQRQDLVIEALEPIKWVRLTAVEPELMLAENASSLFLDPDRNVVAENTTAGDDTKGWHRLLRNLFPGIEKPQDLPEIDWVNVLANAGNQGLDQISKGRIEFSYQPERNNGPEAYLKIGNFSISRSMASN